MKYIITLTALLFVIQSFTQSEIDKICTDYDAKIAQSIEEESPYAVPSLKVTCQLMKRAIGPVDHLITIYFDEYEVEIGQEGMDVFHKEAVIRKAEFTISSVSYTINYAYYFDEGGLLIRYHEKEEYPEGCKKLSYDFQKEELINMTKNETDEGDCGNLSDANQVVTTDPDKGQKAEASYLIADAKRFREILFANYELMKD